MGINIVHFVVEFVKLGLLLFGVLCLEYKKSYVAWGIFGTGSVCLIIRGVQDNEYRISAFSLLVVLICAMLIKGKRKLLLALLSYIGIGFLDDTVSRLADALGIIAYDSIGGNDFLFWRLLRLMY